MPFCSQCGAELKEKDKYCPECGTAAAKPSQPKKKPSKEAKETEAAKGEEKPPEPAPRLKNSGWGIASFVISLVAWIAGPVLFCIGIFTGALVPGAARHVDLVRELLGLVLISLLYVCVYIGPLLGIGLGAAGLLQKNRKRTLAILGLILNIGAIFAGMMMQVVNAFLAL